MIIKEKLEYCKFLERAKLEWRSDNNPCEAIELPVSATNDLKMQSIDKVA